MSFRIMIIFGTRPEAIKMAPLVLRLKQESGFETRVCVTGQHREMLDQVLASFDLAVDDDLAVMQPGQSINGLAASLLTGLDAVYLQHKPDLVLVHGDTTTCFIATLAAFHRRIPVGHVEAGLRTHNLQSPWPEEANRQLAGVLADLHFAPTDRARDNLLRENVNATNIHVTGNTVIDALLWMQQRLDQSGWQPAATSPLAQLRPGAPLILITGHRRESLGSGLLAICRALRRLAERYPHMDFVYPVHLNPAVQQAVFGVLSGIANVHLTEPLDYQHFVWAMSHCHLILTDSGGVQEEAPSLGKPVLVLRDNTERPEALAAGALRVVGVTEDGIYSAACTLLDDPAQYAAMSQARNPFGDGQACERICAALRNWLPAHTRKAAA